MDANEFIGKLKANNTAKDIDLDKVFDEYKVILSQVPAKDRAPFSLNVLCVLCRNIDKAPKWRDSIDNKALLVLSIDCIRETRAMEKPDRVKTLACIYHIHRHVVRQATSVPPELILKISFMPFELEAKHLLNEYAKTYWNILVDRLAYVERLRNKIPIIKLLTKITEDAIKVIEIYDTVQFCSNIIVFLIKKLHSLYTEKHSKELNQIYKEIFEKISEKDLKVFKKLNMKDTMDVYVKLNECLYVVAENASRTYFKDNPLDNIVRTCISIVGHSPDLFHCLQTFYSNAFCSILRFNTHLPYSETVLNSLLISVQTTEKLGYSKAMMATYPYINQFLRLYIDYNINNCSKKPCKDNFNTQIQELCLKLMQILMRKLKNCNQMLKCDGCEVKSGLHDSLRLSFLAKNFLTVSISQNLPVTDTFPLVHDVILEQYDILNELNDLGCSNYEKCLRKQQTDIHNTAIILNKAEHYEFSIKLFNIYLNNEMTTSELKNISRALYNKSICELDSKLYEDALIDAFLSLVYAEGLSSDKYMSLVMDIKAKELKTGEDEDKNEELQMLTVIDACEKAMERKLYGDIQLFLKDLKFSELLKHEFALYARLWPSVTPIGGVWRSLLRLSKGNYNFTDAEASWALYEVIVETPAVVRTITNEHFNTILTDLLETFNEVSLTPDLKIVYSSLLFLKTEFELVAASKKYGWKLSEPVQNLDPDQIPANRTIPQEYNATKSAIQAVSILAELSPDFNSVTKTTCLHNSLLIYQVFVQLLLNLSRDIEGLQLAHICCCIANCVGNKDVFVRNAGTLLYHGSQPDLLSLVSKAAYSCKDLASETSLVFLCNASIYFSRTGSAGAAARLVQLAQAQILAAIHDDPDTNLDLAIGRLLEAQYLLCRDSSPDALSVANSAQRHYLSVGTTGTKWLARRLHSLTVRGHCLRTSARACRAARALRVWRRACAGAAAALGAGAAPARAHLYVHITDTSCFDDAQIKIDNRLKHVLGLQPSNETQPYYTSVETKKETPFTPKQEVETMLENIVFKKSQSSPSIPCTSVPAFKVPDWFEHSEKCQCYACCMPVCYILACHTSGLEAAMYFRANEVDIARNYFNGVVKMMYMTEEKLRIFKKRHLYEESLVESVMKYYWDWLREVKVEILIELSFFELKNGDFEVADEHIVEIHEILQEISHKDLYVYNDVMNLMTCSAQLRKIIRKPETDLEIEFDGLRISPVKFTEPPKTPITKSAKPPKLATKIIVKDEELPKKRKVIKLNLDEGDEKEVKKPDFKVPIPVPSTAKHVLQAATPISKSKPISNSDFTPNMITTKSKRALKSQLCLDSNSTSKSDSANLETFVTPISKSKPKVVFTQPSEETSPKDTTLFSTPKDFTPDQFFTPLTTLKTYTKKSLRHNIVKNLEQEFSTPSADRKTLDKKESSLAKKDSSIDKKESSLANKDSSLDKKESPLAKKESSLAKKDSSIDRKESSVAKKDSSLDKENGKATLQVPKLKTNGRKTLKRATSPGKLCKEARDLPRTRRLRKPVNFSIDDDDRR